ncbi:hypothetical protein FIBSPDRAFT_1045983 [Athelia psychrophila]|uniref:DUF6533 domain-containing protein n=1 Tax=Athelia psychrophila TaxID=1759441 RepID=A0A166HBA5_9AGAM|nr:hypothetical protein FIBSPDRAFT_1045983 [Fibularhizoctonia sp. CBS 109695]
MAGPLLTPAPLFTLENAVKDANATKWLSAAGLTLLLYDHLMTLPDEMELIWRSSPSFSKYAFLFNRYLVPIVLTFITVEMCGFSGLFFSDLVRLNYLISCVMVLTGRDCNVQEIFINTSAVMAIFSLGIADILILIRVITLWEGNKLAARWMYTGFLVSFMVTLGCSITTLIKLHDQIHFVPLVKMCAPTATTPSLVAVWAAPMIFEIIVLISTIWNFFVRPRTANVRLARALHRDGVTFFAILTLLRSLNLALAAMNQPTLSLLSVFFVWSAETVTLNRSLLHVRRVEVSEALASLPEPINMHMRSLPPRTSSSALSNYLHQPDQDGWNRKASTGHRMGNKPILQEVNFIERFNWSLG